MPVQVGEAQVEEAQAGEAQAGKVEVEAADLMPAVYQREVEPDQSEPL